MQGTTLLSPIAMTSTIATTGTDQSLAPIALEGGLTKTARMLFEGVDTSGEQVQQTNTATRTGTKLCGDYAGEVTQGSTVGSEKNSAHDTIKSGTLSTISPLSPDKHKRSISDASTAGMHTQGHLTGIGSLLTSNFAIGSLTVSRQDILTVDTIYTTSKDLKDHTNKKLGKAGDILKLSPTILQTKDHLMRDGDVDLIPPDHLKVGESCTHTDDTAIYSGGNDDEGSKSSDIVEEGEDEEDEGEDEYSLVQEDEEHIHENSTKSILDSGNKGSTKDWSQAGTSIRKASYAPANIFEKMASMSLTMKSRMSGVIMDPAPPLKRSGPMTAMSNLAAADYTTDLQSSSLLQPRDSDETVISNIIDIEAEDGEEMINEFPIAGLGHSDGLVGAQLTSDYKGTVRVCMAVSIIDESLDSSGGSHIFDVDIEEELTNERGILVIQRVSDKLTGMDFDGVPLDIKEQIDRLIKQATSNENLCTCFFGWCPFW